MYSLESQLNKWCKEHTKDGIFKTWYVVVNFDFEKKKSIIGSKAHAPNQFDLNTIELKS